jgi:16S rRNA (guanine527-N7)-methyltransferase
MVSRETSLPGWMEPAAAGLTRYAEILAGPGLERGLMRPREAPRIWDRHILNCAVVADPSLDLVPQGAAVSDIGSGAGLPGVVWALVRPDLTVVLIESLLRRATFLTECIHELDLADRVQVLRTRAESAGAAGPSGGTMDVVTSRAVAPVGTLAEWSAPLLAAGGRMVALKGESAQQEVQRDAEQISAAGLVDVRVIQLGEDVVNPPTTVVVATRQNVARDPS